MKTMRWMMTLAAMGAIATACSVKTTDNDEDSGSGGTGGSGSTATSTATGTTTATGTGTTTGTGSSSSTGGGMSCVGNPFMYKDEACGACAETNCCPELQACGSDQKCLEHFQCGQDCIALMTDNAVTKMCLETCDTTHVDGKALMDAITTCTETKCQMECPRSEPICNSGWVISGTGSNIEACGMCLSDKCCTDYTACAEDTDCSDCIIGTMAPASCDATMLDEAVKSCRDTNCAAECNAP